MLDRRWIAVLTLLVAMHPQASAQDAVHLKWQLAKDRSFYQEMVIDQNVVMTIMGKEITNKLKQTLYLSWTPEKQLNERGWIIKQKILGIKMDMDFLGQKLEYDS